MNFNKLFLVMLLVPAASLMACETYTNPEAEYAAAEQQQYAAIAQQKAAFMALAHKNIALKQESKTLTDKLSGLQSEQSRLQQTIADLKTISAKDQASIAALEQLLHVQHDQLTAQIDKLKTQIGQLAEKNKQLSTLIGIIEKLTGLQFPQSATGEYAFEDLENYFKGIADFANQYASLIQGYQSLHTFTKEIVKNQGTKQSLVKQLQEMKKSIPESCDHGALDAIVAKLEQICKKSAEIDANLGQLERVKETVGKKRPASAMGQADETPIAKRKRT